MQQNLKNHCFSSSQVQYEQSTLPEALLSGTGEVPADQEDELTLTGLQEYVEYTVRVRASNGEGYGPFSSPVSVTTYQDGEFFHPLHQQINCFLLRVCTRQQYVSNNNSIPSVATFSADFHVTNFPCSSLFSASKPSTIVSATSSATAHVGQTT